MSTEYKLVPVEPTPEMLKAAAAARILREDDGDPFALNENTRGTWAATLAASNSAPAEQTKPQPVNERLRDALCDLDARLLACASLGLLASEAYDSFFQEMVGSALAAARAATKEQQ